MSCTAWTENCASDPWHTSQVSTGPFGPFQVMSATWPLSSAPSWQERHTRPDGTVHAVFTHLPPWHSWLTPHGACAEHCAPVSAWQVLHDLTSTGRSA